MVSLSDSSINPSVKSTHLDFLCWKGHLDVHRSFVINRIRLWSHTHTSSNNLTSIPQDVPGLTTSKSLGHATPPMKIDTALKLRHNGEICKWYFLVRRLWKLQPCDRSTTTPWSQLWTFMNSSWSLGGQEYYSNTKWRHLREPEEADKP